MKNDHCRVDGQRLLSELIFIYPKTLIFAPRDIITNQSARYLNFTLFRFDKSQDVRYTVITLQFYEVNKKNRRATFMNTKYATAPDENGTSYFGTVNPKNNKIVPVGKKQWIL